MQNKTVTLKKGDIVETIITDMTEEGKGIGRVSGFAVFIDNCVTGDSVKAKMTRVKKRYGFAELIEIIKFSRYRSTPECKYFGECGGCTLQNMKYEHQLELKRNQIISKLEHIGGLSSPQVKPMTSCRTKRYRNKAVFAVTLSDGIPAVGFRRRGSKTVVECEDCLIQKKHAMAVANAIRELAISGVISVYDEMTGEGALRELTVRSCDGTGESMVIMTVSRKRIPNEKDIVIAIDDAINSIEYRDGADYFLKSVVLEVKKKNMLEPASEYRIIAGANTLCDEVAFRSGRLKFEISAPAFYQVNTEQMKNLYSLALEYAGLTGEETVLDLYCGIGTIGLMMAQKAKMVIGIEEVHSAVIDANRNASINGIVNAVYYTGKAETILPELIETEKLRLDPNQTVAVLDPPRAGCNEKLIRAIANAEITKIVYISCDPATLARDVKLLTKAGYEFIEATPVDMFVLTGNVESVVLMSRK